MSERRTEAGRALQAYAMLSAAPLHAVDGHIAAIEAEARQQAFDEAIAAVRDVPSDYPDVVPRSDAVLAITEARKR